MTCDAGTPTRVFIGFTLTLAVVLAWPGEDRRTVWAQQGDPQFFFSIRDDTTGALVTDLTAEEFEISQDGVPCELVSVDLVATRLQLAIVLDDSGAMRGYHNHMINGMPQFLDALPEGSDVSLITMRDRPRILQDFTTDMAQVKEKFDGDYFPRPGSGAALIDTLHRTVDNLKKEEGEDGVPEGGAFWPVIVVIGSDGGDISRGNQIQKVNDLMDKLRELQVTLNYLMLETTGTGMEHQMRDLFTNATRGWQDRVSGPSQLAVEKLAAMGEVIAEQYAQRANQYRVVFKPATESTSGFSAGVQRPGVTIKVSTDGRPQ